LWFLPALTAFGEHLSPVACGLWLLVISFVFKPSLLWALTSAIVLFNSLIHISRLGHQGFTLGDFVPLPPPINEVLIVYSCSSLSKSISTLSTTGWIL
jgi:hypothetical protein